ncbi:MAG: DNA repair protein RadC [Gammaproteobacteria bacterium]|nr:DNA repair protein RadC [Gammaproteobacteria bacterium]MDH5651244.1 DNA repair protein RadC [Gammaproteobacteria bacterium]
MPTKAMRKTVKLSSSPSDLKIGEMNIIVKLAFDILSERSDYSKLLSVVNEDVIIKLATDILARRHSPGMSITNPTDTKRYLKVHFSGFKNEAFCVLFLDNRHRVISFEKLFTGTINSASVHPRVVVQRALELNAAAIILSHNHPSGVAEPSEADRQLTTRLKNALDLVDVRVLDHLVVGSDEIVAFAERGWL